MNFTRINIEAFSKPSRTLEERRSISSSSWLDNLRSNNLPSHRLEEVIDIDWNLELFSNEQLDVLNLRRLYGWGLLSFANSIYRHHRTEAMGEKKK